MTLTEFLLARIAEDEADQGARLLTAEWIDVGYDGRRAYLVDGEYVCADGGGWLDGVRPTVEAWRLP